MSSSPFRAIPSVDKVLNALGAVPAPRLVVKTIIRRELAALRAEKAVTALNFESVLSRVRAALDHLLGGRLQTVINGTGILLHTNLGRAPLPDVAVEAIATIGASYCNLEYDLQAGERGERAAYLEHNIALLCRAEAATVVNNCAAALILMLRHFTRSAKKEVIISRGELIQIGGGFRIPEILEASGAQLREVGTTNKTTLEDYAAAVTAATALILKVHRSNFYQGGFVGSVETADLAAMARKQRVPVAEDLGSGAMVNIDKYVPVEHERTPTEAIRDGVDLVCFSGDKLFGGPQAGLIAGRARRVAAIKREPFFRALRCDKLVLAALQATTDLYLEGLENDIPILAMMRTSADVLRRRAYAILAALDALPLNGHVKDAISRIGGGTLPRVELASVTLDLQPDDGSALNDFAARLRGGTPPVIGYISGNRFRLDLRTVFPMQDETLIQAIHALFPA